MKKIFRITSAILSAFIVSQTAISAFAYDDSQWELQAETNEDGEVEKVYWYLDGTDREDSCTTCMELYVYTDPVDASYSTYKSYYGFDCYTGLPEGWEEDIGDDRLHFLREFLIMGSTPVAELSCGSVYCFYDFIEPGKYCFSFPNAIENNNIRVLTQDFHSPMVGDGFYTEGDLEEGNVEVIEISDKTGIRVYAYFGSEEWLSNPEVLVSYIAWARDNEAQRKYDYAMIFGDGSAESVAMIEALNPGSQQEEEEVVEEEVNEFVPSTGPTRNVSVSMNVIEPEVEEKKPVSPALIIGISLAAILTGGIAWWNKKRNEY